mgnify:CR=1 FL=1
MRENLADIEKNALKWLKSQLKKNNLVFLKSSIDDSIYRYLTNKSLMASLNKQYCFLKTEYESDKQAFMANLWVILFQFLNLSFDNEWYLIGEYAYKLNLENFSLTNQQISIQTKKKSNRSIKILSDIEIIAIYDKDFDGKPIVEKKFLETSYYLPRTEYLVIQASLNDYKVYKDELVSFIQSSERDEDYIKQYFMNNNNPVLLARLIGALRQLEDFSLRIDLEEIAKLSGSKVSVTNPFEDFQVLSSIERPAYLNRFQISMDKAIKALSKLKLPRRLAKKVTAKDIDGIITDDAYHSLTIEGYTVTKALISYLAENDENTAEQFPQDLRNQLAAKGFMNVLTYIKKLISSSFSINERLVARLFEELWKPSMSADIVSPTDIYRKHMVTIRGALHVPPAYEKVPYLIDELFEKTKEIENGFCLAIFLHFFYVGVHPHSDGNGRISRFLMNLAFINDKYKWLTIPSYERKNYFSALEKSQVEDDISYFAEFILDTYKKDLDL